MNARAAEIAAAKVETANLARSLAQHVHDMLGTADTLLVSLRDNIEADGDSPLQRKHLGRLLASQIATVPAMRDLMVFDAGGFRIVNSGRPAPAIENNLDREYFQYHAAHEDRAVHFGKPVRGKLDGTWIITLSRRIDDVSGAFGGVVAATFPVSAFRQFYETFDVGKQGFIGLNTTDGVIITRYPRDDTKIGSVVTGKIADPQHLAAFPTAGWQSVSPVDGIEHSGTYRTVEAYPLVVTVGRGTDELLTEWREDAQIHFAISAGSALVILLLGLRFARQLGLQRRAERALQRRERQYRMLADNNTDLIVQVDPTMRCVYASPASQALLGYTPDKLIGNSLAALAHPADWPALVTHLAAIGQSGTDQNGTGQPISYRAIRADGSEVWVEAVGRRLDGRAGFILVKREITERRNAEIQLRQAQRMEVVGQLTAGVAHDFNNILQAQGGALELLLTEVPDRPKALRLATMALGAVEHAAKLTHSLLSFSRQQVLDPEPVAVPALLGRLEAILSRTLGPRVALQFDMEANLPPLFADPAQVEAALLNLALNARDAMPDGGCLSIQACTAETALGTPEGLEPGKHMLIAVTDDGVGMSPATLAQACEPFFTTKGIGKGSGLGLSMVQGFARQSGGALRFDSALGRGTRIELWLPIAPIPCIGNPAIEPEPAKGVGRILLVDDVEELLLVMTEILQSAGFVVVAAANGEAALQELGTGQRFDALVTDFAMPGIDGVELICRAQRMLPNLPASIITGYAESERLLALPADVSVLRKPIRGAALTRHIAGLIKLGSPLQSDSPEQHKLPAEV